MKVLSAANTISFFYRIYFSQIIFVLLCGKKVFISNNNIVESKNVLSCEL